ncbi:MAG: peptide chain release factor 1 [Alphaproteobacteria bacterium]
MTDQASFVDKLSKVIERHQDLGDQLSQGALDGKEFAQASKEYSDMGPIVEAINEYIKAIEDSKDLEAMVADQEGDADLREMATAELEELQSSLPEHEQQIKVLLLPKDEDDERNAIVEVRAGTGGDEAALFASDLLRMYQRYAENHGWKTELMSISDTGIGGVKDASMMVSGKNVFARLKFESGVHRVQRVPETETSGRIHTSAATVAVLPEAEEVDIEIDEKDLRIDYFRSSGPGGQHVNTTDSAVRITHIPTGVVVAQQDEKSQHKNKAKAMKILRSRIYEAERQRKESERAAARKSQVGSGDRSERIRTYNFPQGRVTDHRIGLTLYKIEEILNGEGLDEVVDALTAEDQASKLSEIS